VSEKKKSYKYLDLQGMKYMRNAGCYVLTAG